MQALVIKCSGTDSAGIAAIKILQAMVIIRRSGKKLYFLLPFKCFSLMWYGQQEINHRRVNKNLKNMHF
jgi:hypothetical protein